MPLFTPTNKSRYVRVLSATVSILLIVIVCIAVSALVQDPGFDARPKAAAPVEGLTILAVFFVGALAIERLLEPIAGVLLPKADKEEKAKNTATAAAQQIDAAAAAQQPNPARPTTQQPNPAAPTTQQPNPAAPAALGNPAAPAGGAIDEAAKAKTELSDWVWARTILYWAIASSIGVYVSAAMKLYLLRTVGIGDASHWQEVLATGLIIGAGTKPLHDLTKLIVAQKEAKQATQ